MISMDDASQVDAAIHAMVYAEFEENYRTSYESLEGICDRVGLQEFFRYFEKNWDTSQERWVLYHRAKLPHFKNHTNNRLENFFGKFKEAVDGSMSMAGCIKALVAYDRRKENEYAYRLARIGVLVNSNFDEEMSNVLRFTSHFVAEQIAGEYTQALANVSGYKFTKCCGDKVLVQGSKKTHHICVDAWECDCEFSLTMMLPCRHTIAFRKKEAVPGSVIPLNRIDLRWTSTSRELRHVKQFSYEPFPRDSNKAGKVMKRTQAQRYREAVRATHLICTEMADIEDDVEFDHMLEFVMSQWRNVRQRKMSSGSRGLYTADDGEHRSKQHEITDQDAKAERNDRIRANPPKIRLNPKTKKVGAPRKHRNVTAARERADRKWYQAAVRARKAAGEVTLEDLLDSLEREQPSLMVTQRRLKGVLVKYADAESKKPKFKFMKNPVIVQDPFYILPEKLLAECMNILPVSNTEGSAIAVDSSQDASQDGVESGRNESKTGLVETVVIKDVGSFTRVQIEIFVRVQNLKKVVQLGIDMHKWLTLQGIPALPAEYHDIGNKVAADILDAYPNKLIQGLP
ncbi:hypothetical protein PHMEG_00033583, partial [Phytophthora megakarya]